MIYRIIIDDNTDIHTINENLLYYSGDPVYVLDDIELDLVLGEAGELRFTIYSNHPHFSKIKMGTSRIYMYRDSELLFDGFISEIQRNIYNALTVYVTGLLGALNYTVQPQAYIVSSPTQYLEHLLDIHNDYAALAPAAPFTIHPGTVDVDDDRIVRYANYETTFECVRGDLMESFTVYPKLEYGALNSTNGKNPTLSLYPIENYGALSNQVVEMGENILEYAEDEMIDNLYTAVIPLGKRKDKSQYTEDNIEALDAYVDISSVNNGVLYLYNYEGVVKYGFKCAVVQWEDVTLPKNLKKKAQAWLDSAQYSTLILELTAVDLAMLGNNIDTFKLGDRVNVLATPLGIDITLPIFEMSIYPLRPDENTITLGADAPALIGREIPEKGIKTDADIVSMVDWNYDYCFDVIEQQVTDIPNYWNTDKAQREPVTICQNYTFTYPAMPSPPTTVSLGIDTPALLSQDNLVFDIGQVDYNTTFKQGQINYGTDQNNYAVADITGMGVYEAEFGSNTDFCALMPQAGAGLTWTRVSSGVRPAHGITIKINSISGVVQRKVFPWYTIGKDLSGNTTDGSSSVSGGWLALTGKYMLCGLFVWADETSHPQGLKVTFTVKREVITDTDLQLVDNSGNNLSAGGSNVLGYTYPTMTDADEVLKVNFGNVTYTISAGDLDTAPQTMTLDLSGDTQNAETYQGHYMKQIRFYVDAPYRIYITDVHINGDARYWTDNPYNELIAF